MSKQMISIQKQLIKQSLMSSIIAMLVALLMLIAMSSYQIMQTHDEIMDEISDMLMVSDITSTSGVQIDELSEEFKVDYYLILDELVLTQNNPHAILNLDLNQPPVHGYGYRYVDGKIWRTYAQYDNENELLSYLVQPLSYRFTVLIQGILLFVFIIVLVWILQFVLLKRSIQSQLKSLNQLSSEISQINVKNLIPLEASHFQITELQPIVLQLNQLLQRLDLALQSEQRFTADASHELRSPLSAIQMRLQVLARKNQHNVELNNHIQALQADVSRGSKVLENLLLLARLDPQDHSELVKKPIDIYTLIQDVIENVQRDAEQKNIVWQKKLQSASVTANAELIKICLRNLLDNAIRYQKDGGIIKVEMLEQSSHILIVIEDDGPHLTDEALDRMGERFYRALGTKAKGSGLGLSICKKIIDLHGGQITYARSTLGGLKATIQMSKL